jgi:hypothetical protein
MALPHPQTVFVFTPQIMHFRFLVESRESAWPWNSAGMRFRCWGCARISECVSPLSFLAWLFGHPNPIEKDTKAVLAKMSKLSQKELSLFA